MTELFVIAAFKRTETKSILYKNTSNPETIQRWVGDALHDGADVISIRRVTLEL